MYGRALIGAALVVGAVVGLGGISRAQGVPVVACQIDGRQAGGYGTYSELTSGPVCGVLTRAAALLRLGTREPHVVQQQGITDCTIEIASNIPATGQVGAQEECLRIFSALITLPVGSAPPTAVSAPPDVVDPSIPAPMLKIMNDLNRRIATDPTARAAAERFVNSAPIQSGDRQLNAVARGEVGDRARECWTKNPGAGVPDTFHVHLIVTTDAQGVARLATIAPGDPAAPLGSPLHAFAERAVRAVLAPQCSALPLPETMRGQIHRFDFIFKP